ncbi:hypothetical protein DH2020_006247 [Rehmannia glutinosa]|uniref:PRONE domain-containing protein n=1 Tax=Rehmannia glutinosa TaxID=99300 RepID=A0ABR0XIQ5_REHGL
MDDKSAIIPVTGKRKVDKDVTSKKEEIDEEEQKVVKKMKILGKVKKDVTEESKDKKIVADEAEGGKKKKKARKIVADEAEGGKKKKKASEDKKIVADEAEGGKKKKKARYKSLSEEVKICVGEGYGSENYTVGGGGAWIGVDRLAAEVEVSERGIQKSRSFHFRKMFDINPVRQGQNFVHENGNGREAMDEKIQSRNEGAAAAALIGTVLESIVPVSPLKKDGAASGISKKDKQVSTDMELMKERFSKLLLGEDMSGGGKGVSSALALSNAITNLAVLLDSKSESYCEPMSVERKARWKKEIDWLLSVTDYIVEFVPSQQKSKDGTNMEIMVTQQRRDLLLNIPALRKLDVMLLGILDNFVEEQEFKYVSRDADESEKGIQRNDKWWLPTVKVPPNGLSEESRQFLQKQKEAVNQVLKASMAINAQILSDMEIPDNYIESLPKNGRASLGESIYKSITVEFLIIAIPFDHGLVIEHKDVGLSILESYSRVLESLANTVMSRIQDVLYADSLAQDPSLAVVTWKQSMDSIPSPTLSSFPSPSEEAEKLSSAAETPTSMTLSDFMGWNLEPP